MLARFLALFCLLFVSSLIGRSEAFGPPPGSVAVYFQGAASNSDLALDSLKTELKSLLNGAAYKIQWGDSQKPSVNVGHLVVVELHGSCSPSSAPFHISENGSRLASSQLVDEQILPFLTLDCGAVNDLLGFAIAQLPPGQRDVVYGRALARLLAHEFYHFLTQTTHHTKSGIAKARVNAADLLSDHFDFDGEAFAKLHESLLPARQHTAALKPSAEHGL